MTDDIDNTQIHMSKPDRVSKYGQCDYCGMFSQTLGKCPWCGKGTVR